MICGQDVLDLDLEQIDLKIGHLELEAGHLDLAADQTAGLEVGFPPVKMLKDSIFFVALYNYCVQKIKS